jgi:glucans biosynthesis protein
VPARFTFDNVVGLARDLARAAFQPSPDDLPEPLRGLSYDRYRAIRFLPERALWREEGLPFHLHFYPRGGLFSHEVRINIVAGEQVFAVGYSPTLFDATRAELDLNEFGEEIGFAGFRLQFPINRPDYHDEIASFLGASYFRGLGRGQVYGISARAVAIDTGLERPEEFPFFREFWIVRPQPGAAEITVLALVDSPRLTGAHRFVIRPGDATVFETDAVLFTRASIARLGVAPLTSMFLYGESSGSRPDNYRPEVHDSDGLLVSLPTYEWLWRPLRNPSVKEVTSIGPAATPQGFGLLQRDRAFASYQDLEAAYQQRPSGWVEPVGEWGEGAVHLLELPASDEGLDNIVAFWTPTGEVAAGEERRYQYRVTFALELAGRPPAGQVVATNSTPSPLEGGRRFLIDFAGGPLDALGADAEVVAEVSTSAGAVRNVVTQHNPFIGGWRAFFDLEPPAEGGAELRAFLRSGSDVLTETWSYPWRRK